MRAENGQRGAITIHVAIALTAMLAFVSFVADFGVLWVARGQAQNAADAAALAGVISWFRDGRSPNNATLEALTVAAVNPVWGQGNSGNVDIAYSSQTGFAPCGTAAGCVRADVYRGAADRGGTGIRGSALPVFFGALAGITTQGVRATATASAMVAPVVDALRPWALADRWQDLQPPASEFNGAPDRYDFPTAGHRGTGYWPGIAAGATSWPAPNPVTSGWRGVQLVLRDSGGVVTTDWPGGDFKRLTLSCAGGNCYQATIEDGTDQRFGIGDGVTVSADVSDTSVAVEALVLRDAGAHWDPVTMAVVTTAATSPRTVPVPVFDPAELAAAGPGALLTIRNFVGFFVEGTCAQGTAGAFVLESGNSAACAAGGAVVGRVVGAVGRPGVASAPIGLQSSFYNAYYLVR